MNKSVSIIVPTHNRSASLKRLLDNIGLQTYPTNYIEAVIVADGCQDNTVDLLQEYSSSYSLKWIELPGLGAATARNSGAEIATGEILLFLDDDIEPSLGLVQAHVVEHTKENVVVVGYLPMTLHKKATFHQINLATWWEQKYFKMRNKYYRYSYEDLLSGNFSISADFFNKVKKFDSSLKCREDYELGARLIESGAELIFSMQAWGHHRDESTDFPALLKRRRAEGKADVHFARKHPDLLTQLRVNHYYGHLSRSRKILRYFAFNIANFTDRVAHFLIRVLNFYERLKKRQSWHKLNSRLNDYWYLRGMADELKTEKEYLAFLDIIKSNALKEPITLPLELKFGISEAEKQIDLYRPAALSIYWGDHFIGEVKPVPGMEKLRGIHLKPILVTEFSETLTHALMIEKVVKQSMVLSENC